MKSRESTTTLMGCESCVSRGLVREALGLWIFSMYVQRCLGRLSFPVSGGVNRFLFL